MTQPKTMSSHRSRFPISLGFLAAGAILAVACSDDTSVGAKTCGDGLCADDESTQSCPEDCTCGNGTCDQGEDLASCVQDCSECGDGQCTGPEDCASCAQDCGVCPTCGDGVCNGDENCETCLDDCGRCGECGNGTLEYGEECDATDFGQQDCVTMGFDGGELACDENCLIDTQGCWKAECGNGTCEAGETSDNCPQDCNGSCGDQLCSLLDQETCESCGADCSCGDNDCRAYLTCLYDCSDASCADGCYQESCVETQTAAMEIQACMNDHCATDCTNPSADGCANCMLQNCGTTIAACYEVVCSNVCGNGTCEPGETSDNCPQDCPRCGDGICSPQENDANCASDCASGCGNETCDASEDCETCPTDCGSCPPTCGNGTCEPTLGETCAACPADCTCGTETCMQIIQCTQNCGADQSCVDGCVEGGCYEGQVQAQDLYQCMLTK